MTPEGGGYFIHRQSQIAEGLRYAFQLADGCEYPDPASRSNPTACIVSPPCSLPNRTAGRMSHGAAFLATSW